MKSITLCDDKLFALYDKGSAVRSKTLRFHSHKDEDSDEFARWYVEAVGYPRVHSTKEIGVPDYEVRTTGKVKGYYGRGTRVWVVKDLDDTPPAHGWEATVNDQKTGYRQWVGKVLKVAVFEDGWIVECERPFGYTISHGAAAYFYRPGVLPTDNLLVPKLCTIEIWYEQAEGPASPVPTPVEVYRRFWPRGMTSFYFADKIAEINDGETIKLDAGYYAFVSQHELQDLEVEIEGEVYIHHYNAPAAPFDVVTREVAKPAYFLSAGLWVEQTAQDSARYRAPGESKVIINGDPLFDEKSKDVEGPGGVFFGRGPGGGLWIGRNVVGYDAGPRTFVKGCAIGRFDGARVDGKFYYRPSDDYLGLAPYELTSGFTVTDKEIIGARLLTGRVWIKTRLEVVYASPPDSDSLPIDYDGGCAAVLMVAGDRTGLVEEGDVVRLGGGPDEEPFPREYVVSESGTGARYIPADCPYAVDDSWRNRTDIFTWFVIMELEPPGDLDYEDLVRLETLGKYISVARGWDTRYEMWRMNLTPPSDS